MSTQPNSSVPVEKQRMRDQINRQVQDFLHRGGKINVVNQQISSSAPLGGIWQTLNDEMELDR